MKEYICSKIAWGLYYLGDFTSKVMDKTHAWFLYPLYNYLMCKSYDLQSWAGDKSGPWKDKENV